MAFFLQTVKTYITYLDGLVFSLNKHENVYKE